MIFHYPCNDSTKCQPITIDLLPGKYLFECYGAQGGTGMMNSQYMYPGGKGAYASGILALSQKTQFFLYPGGAGQKGIAQMNTFATGGWNGGSNSGRDIGGEADLPDSAGSGAGATDIRLIAAPEGEESTNEESLKSRIIVAGGGSGASANAHGAPGGDINSYKVIKSYDDPLYGIAETGTTLGQGGVGGDLASVPGSGAGGGYYGGFGSPGDDVDACRAVSGSGTSYVAGHKDCPEFSHPRDPDFKLVFRSPRICNGFTDFPSLTHDIDGTTEKGHEGNGAIKITKIPFCSHYCNNSRRLSFVAFLMMCVFLESNA